MAVALWAKEVPTLGNYPWIQGTPRMVDGLAKSAMNRCRILSLPSGNFPLTAGICVLCIDSGFFHVFQNRHGMMIGLINDKLVAWKRRR